MVKDKYNDLPYIYKVRRALEDCVEEKLNGNVTDAGTWLDYMGADFAFEFKNRRYSIEINDITSEEDKPKATTSKEWVKGYKKWQNEGVYGQQEQEELNASYKQSLANKKEREKK